MVPTERPLTEIGYLRPWNVTTPLAPPTPTTNPTEPPWKWTVASGAANAGADSAPASNTAAAARSIVFMLAGSQCRLQTKNGGKGCMRRTGPRLALPTSAPVNDGQ